MKITFLSMACMTDCPINLAKAHMGLLMSKITSHLFFITVLLYIIFRYRRKDGKKGDEKFPYAVAVKEVLVVSLQSVNM